MTITIFTDNIKSWFLPYGKKLRVRLSGLGHEVKYVFNKKQIRQGDICFLLSCSLLVDEDSLQLNRHNIVVHASDLPKGKGFSPLQWQILEGKNKITLTIFEVVKECDAGPYYFKSKVIFNGTELYDELRDKLANKIIEMCLKFVKNYKSLKAFAQSGKESFYPRRTLKDDELDINKTIAGQFNHLRIADNERFPVYFQFRGHKYILKIYKEK